MNTKFNFTLKGNIMQKNYIKKNIDFYSDLVEKHGIDIKSLNWGSKESQELRFKILSELTELNNKSIVDIGCGLGDFYKWLQENNISTNYTGIDITPKMIEKAKERFPNTNFEVNNFLIDNFSYTPDCIVASGIFTYQNRTFLEHFITKSFDKIKHSLAFNSLSSLANDKEQNEFYPNPLEILAFCQKITPWTTLRQDYHSRDFTIYMYKEKNK